MTNRSNGSFRRFGPRLAAIALLALASGTGSGSAAAADPVPPNHVTVITDSVGGVLFWVTQARVELARGLDLDLETKTCRKLVDPGCPAYGDPAPPSVLETARSLGAKLGPTVVIDVGYNDPPDLYAAHLDEVMGVLLAAGVQHVLWVTLEEVREAWTRINDQIREAPRRWPQLAIADWAVASAGRPWFSDGVHMTYEGGLEFARFLRPFVLEACGEPCAPPPPLEIATERLPTAQRGRRYTATAAARGGVSPYHWSVTGLPRRLHLSGDGRITGIPRAAGLSFLVLRVRDAWDEEATARLALHVDS